MFLWSGGSIAITSNCIRSVALTHPTDSHSSEIEEFYRPIVVAYLLGDTA